jgi:hypothetical protein
MGKGIKLPKHSGGKADKGTRAGPHRWTHTITPVENATAHRERRKRDAIRS